MNIHLELTYEEFDLLRKLAKDHRYHLLHSIDMSVFNPTAKATFERHLEMNEALRIKLEDALTENVERLR